MPPKSDMQRQVLKRLVTCTFDVAGHITSGWYWKLRLRRPRTVDPAQTAAGIVNLTPGDYGRGMQRCDPSRRRHCSDPRGMETWLLGRIYRFASSASRRPRSRTARLPETRPPPRGTWRNWRTLFLWEHLIP
ncbi:hypothetical protein LX36DRAFT_123993 [Colletotrichum falcatum]|nr:hypothetical protein LX36DRAFT_123993 [Colletotrichum falcatum]